MVESARRGATWTTLDQIASTASNSLVLVFVSYSSGKDGLVGFSFAFTIYLIVLGLNRAFLLESSLVSHESRRGTSETVALSASFAGGLVVGGVLYVLGSALDRPTIIALSAVIAGLLLQDAARFIAFRRLNSRIAFEVDGVWCVLLPVLIIVPADPSGANVTATWGACASLAGLYGVGRLRIRPSLSREALRTWFDGHGKMGGSLVLDGLIFAFGQQALILIVVELSTDDFGLADFRAGQTLIGPLAALFPVLNMLLLPRLAQGYAGRRLLPLVSSVAVATALVYTTVLMLASGIVSQLLFNEQVRLSLTLICLAGVQVLSYSFVLGRVAVLRARHQMREILVSRTLSTVAGACVGFSYVLLPVPEILGASLAVQSVLFSAILLIITRTLNSKGAEKVHMKEGS